MADQVAVQAKVELLRERLRAAAIQAVQEVYGPEGMPWGTRFDELEELAITAGGIWEQEFMQSAVRAQAAREAGLPPEWQVCPRCGGGLAPEPPEPRILTTQSCQVEWQEPQRTCESCRKSFFPSVEESGDRPDGGKPGRATQGRLRRKQAVLSRGGQGSEGTGRD